MMSFQAYLMERERHLSAAETTQIKENFCHTTITIAIAKAKAKYHHTLTREC
jgi:hypothetical protein